MEKRLTGLKHDGEKPDLSLLPPEALFEVARVLTFGAKKYSAQNWRGGFNYTRVYAGVQRHLNAWLMGEDLDPETKLSHIGHAICGLMFLMTFILTNTGKDDRFKYTNSEDQNGTR